MLPLDFTFFGVQASLGGKDAFQGRVATTCLLETSGDTHTNLSAHAHCPVLAPPAQQPPCHQPIPQTRTLRPHCQDASR